MLFFAVLVLLLIVSILLAMRSLKKINERPQIEEVKKSLDKHRIIFHGHSSG